MKVGLTVADFTWPDGPAGMGSRLGEIARTAEEAGFTSLSVMDHFFQIPMNGPVEAEMLDGYTALGFMAAHTSRVALGTLVTGVHYRHPGLLAKIVTTLDVLSGGRAFLGIGAGWNERESKGLGVPFPSLGDRFEQLEETLRICLQMWAGDPTPIEGRHFHLTEPLNSPQVLQRPHPRILIGGSGERKTLRLVARYADACNLWPDPKQVASKLAVLREHCQAEGRDFDSIERTVAYVIDLGPNGERLDATIEELACLAELGIQTVYAGVKPAHDLGAIEMAGERLLPALAKL
jgi:F420-dependent oxidoreductase-like protein